MVLPSGLNATQYTDLLGNVSAPDATKADFLAFVESASYLAENEERGEVLFELLVRLASLCTGFIFSITPMFNIKTRLW